MENITSRVFAHLWSTIGARILVIFWFLSVSFQNPRFFSISSSEFFVFSANCIFFGIRKIWRRGSLVSETVCEKRENCEKKWKLNFFLSLENQWKCSFSDFKMKFNKRAETWENIKFKIFSVFFPTNYLEKQYFCFFLIFSNFFLCFKKFKFFRILLNYQFRVCRSIFRF